MYSTLSDAGHGSLSDMVAIEAKRFVRHPLFVVGALVAYGLTAFVHLSGDADFSDALLAYTIVPAFFIGVPSVVVAARLTRSTEVAVEAIGTTPRGEARRTLAVIGACLVPLVAGVLWTAELFVLVALKGPHPNELWFGTMNDLYVWSILIALGPMACLGGALLGVLVGRWLRFPGAPAVAMVALVVIDLLPNQFVQYGDANVLRLFVPWAMFHTGSMTDGAYQGIPNNAQGVLAGNPFWYLCYVVMLCLLAAGGALWHDRSARTRRLRIALLGTVALAVVFLALAMLTGVEVLMISEPLPFPSDG